MTGISETSDRVSKKQMGSSLKILLLFILSTFLIYLSVIHRYFVSDDFKVLYRVCVEKVIFIKSFFRPLSDISIYLNYRMAGFNPVIFNSFNIGVHAINVWLVYLVCLSLAGKLGKTNQKKFALVSSLFFLFYPFHNEAVVWLLGRGASLACLFALLSLICFYGVKKKSLKVLTVSACYFISLSAFESTIFFPVIFISLLVFEKQNLRSVRNWAAVLSVTLLIHLILRYRISGSLLGSYGQDFFHSGLKVYCLNMVKVGGRLILPPAGNAVFMAGAFLILTLTCVYFLFRYRKKLSEEPSGKLLLCLTAMLVISCIIPVITGVSTQTSETDRALYFPSVFLCMMVALVIVCYVKKRGMQMGIILLICGSGLFLLEKNNLNWIKASGITSSIMGAIATQKNAKENGRIFFLNIPNEINGAFVFRLGFSDALKLNGFDPVRYVAVNYLPRQDLEKMKDSILVEMNSRFISLPPDILLSPDSSGCRQIIDHGVLKYHTSNQDQIYFWNLDHLDGVPACLVRVPG
jgi:hypothetical protein